jgi:hypothetical protein
MLESFEDTTSPLSERTILTPTPFLAALSTWFLMLVAYGLHRQRWFHVAVMVGCILFDLAMPFFLYSHRDWYRRMIVQEDITSFLAWMHFGLLVALYALEWAQVYTAVKMLRGQSLHSVHRGQGKALLLVRGLVIVTGGILA